MNEVLAEIYSTILPSAPYIIAAYALIWLALLVYVFIVMRGATEPARGVARAQVRAVGGGRGLPRGARRAVAPVRKPGARGFVALGRSAFRQARQRARCGVASCAAR